MSESTNIVLEENLTIKYFNEEGQLHRVYGPAVILPDGGQKWYQNGRLHRVDGPAIVYADGKREWCINGVWHREDGPAIVYADGSQVWCQNGVWHREDGPAYIEANGEQSWWLFDIKVTEKLVKNLHSLTADLIHQQNNTELRAWLINRMGWVNYLREINAQPIDARDNDIENTKEALYQIENQKQLLVTCPTGRVFSLHVPDRIETCEQAQSWLGNDTENNYNVIGRT